ncbi:MAG: glycosyltransferase family 2 protein [Flavobacteriales bacterium]|nr:glycosyltransferase family 2 protein [Flavobacteriales bacterium]
MELVYFIMIGVYGVFILFIFLYSLMQANLVFNYWRSKKEERLEVKGQSEKLQEESEENESFNFQLSTFNYPQVTIQLPIFNERYVVERLIDCIMEFDYPKDKLEIQVLDDSTDDTAEIIANKVAEVKVKGFDIVHITRTNRQGYKAGALAEATPIAKGEFIAIFDADFLPKRDFLKQTIPHFQNKKVGVVQTKWEHLNTGYSMLTSLQAFGLDAHFTVEQRGRNSANHFINFNGTAGVWRKTCIADAGGWESDTLTEDLDLSYRAQLKGWKFKYLENVESPAELPATMNALKTQQFRWTKGAAECTRKNLVRVLQSSGVKTSTKLHAIFHLMNSFLFVCILCLSVLSVPMLVAKNNLPNHQYLFEFGSLFLVSLLILSLFYWVSYNTKFKNKLISLLFFAIKFPLFLAVSMGLSLHNSIAVMEGYMGKKSPFVRTPKFNITANDDKWRGNKYITNAINPLTMVEGGLILYFLYGIFLSFRYGDYGLMPFYVMLTLGYSIVFYYSIYHSLNMLRNRKKVNSTQQLITYNT